LLPAQGAKPLKPKSASYPKMATLTKRLSRAALAGLYPRCEGGVEGHRHDC
jgi:hypothetical protein